MRKTIAAGIVGVIALLAVSSTSAEAPASVRVGHGIPGQDLGLAPELPVDVLVNDSICLLTGFKFGEFAGPVELAPGTYDIKVSLANPGDPCSNSAVIEADIPFASGEDSTVLAHLTAAGAPTASKFTNDLSRPGLVKSRVTAHHTAAAPAVDIALKRVILRGSLTIEDATNGAQASATVSPGLWKVSISPANTGTPVFETALVVKPLRTYFVYAVGSLESGSFTLLVQSVKTA